ncbi:MAG: PAS domain S-box protein, partial [Acidobacteriota bacterium]
MRQKKKSNKITSGEKKNSPPLDSVKNKRSSLPSSSEEKFNLIFQYAPDAYYINDFKGNFLDGNQAAEELTGYKKEELIGKNMLESGLLPPDQIPIAVNNLKRNAAGEATGPDEIIIVRKDSSRIPVEIRTFPVTIQGKSMVLAIARDISARNQKQAERIIRRRNAQLELIRRIQQEIPMDTDIETILKNSSESIGKIFGYHKVAVNLYDEKTKEIIHLLGWNTTGVETPRNYRQKLGQGLIGKAAADRKTILCNDVSTHPDYFSLPGEKTQSELCIPLLAENRLVGVLDIQDNRLNAISEEDISILKSIARYIAYVINARQKEEALEESLSKHRDILTNMQEAYYETDLQGNFTFFNDSLCLMLDLPASRIKGMNNREYMDEESAKRVFNIFNKVYQTGKPFKAVELEVTREDGTRKYVEFSVSLKKDRQGKPSGFWGIIHDVTEHKEAENALQKANTWLY